LKTGHLLGASARRQLMAQLLGTAAGAALVASLFRLLIADPSALAGQRFPAPGALMSLGIARLCASGLEGIPAATRAAFLGAAAIGIVLGAGEALAPAALRRWLPSAVGIALSLFLPVSMCLSLFLGALGARWLSRTRAGEGERYLVPISAGLIAGESVVAVVATALLALGIRR
jgi:uncharacterized oligopeptide transporter (OPT) family protein